MASLTAVGYEKDKLIASNDILEVKAKKQKGVCVGYI